MKRPPDFPEDRLHAESFPEAQTTFAKGQEEYNTLKGFLDKNDEFGTAVFHWRLGWRQRLSVRITGSIWQASMTFHKPLQPLSMATDVSSFLTATNKPSFRQRIARGIVMFSFSKLFSRVVKLLP